MPWHGPCCEVGWGDVFAILGRGWDEWYACSAGFTGRTPHYSSIIDYLFILYDTSLALFMITSQCFGPNKPSFACINQWGEKTNKHTDNFLNWAACPAKVPWNILFMLASWWCKSEKLWDVLFKHTYVCRQMLYLHSGGVFHRDQCALNSQLSTDVWQRVEMLGLNDRVSLLWLWRQGHQVRGGRRKVGARERRKKAAQRWLPRCHTQCQYVCLSYTYHLNRRCATTVGCFYLALTSQSKNSKRFFFSFHQGA